MSRSKFGPVTIHYAEKVYAQFTICNLITKYHPDWGKTGAPRSAIAFTTGTGYVSCQNCRNRRAKIGREISNGTNS